MDLKTLTQVADTTSFGIDYSILEPRKQRKKFDEQEL